MAEKIPSILIQGISRIKQFPGRKVKAATMIMPDYQQIALVTEETRASSTK